MEAAVWVLVEAMADNAFEAGADSFGKFWRVFLQDGVNLQIGESCIRFRIEPRVLELPLNDNFGLGILHPERQSRFRIAAAERTASDRFSR